MTKIELIELVRNDMLDAVKRRDDTNADHDEEGFGYFNGQYRALESVLRLLTMFHIEELDGNDSRRIRQ
jgi:hypothetical protein